LEELREFRNQAPTKASGEEGKEEKECQNQLVTNQGDMRRDN